MLSKLLMCAAFALSSLAAQAAPDLDSPAARLVARQILRDLVSPKSKKTIRGARALWIDLVVQKPEGKSAFSTLEADLKSSDIEAQLREAKFRIMDPNKKSLALGLRPTLSLMVLRSPAGAEGSEKGFYVVTASAIQDCTPLGGEIFSTPTWLKIGSPVEFSGDDHKDIDAIRASARLCVKAFIDAALDHDEESPEAK